MNASSLSDRGSVQPGGLPAAVCFAGADSNCPLETGPRQWRLGRPVGLTLFNRHFPDDPPRGLVLGALCQEALWLLLCLVVISQGSCSTIGATVKRESAASEMGGIEFGREGITDIRVDQACRISREVVGLGAEI